MRKEPEMQNPPAIEPIQKNKIQIRKYEVITPLYGGGVEPGKADPITTVRATEIRGQLRFWWRAVCGGKFDGNLEEMRQAEENIWGCSASEGKAGPSTVSVCILGFSRGNVMDSQDNHLLYVTFPLRDYYGRNSHGKVQKGVSFTMEISYPDDLEEDINAVLWAWEHFGGIGARTRRGFGALCCTARDGMQVNLATKMQTREQIEKWLKSLNGHWHSDIPHISSRTEYTCIESQNVMAAWEYLIGALKHFRQQFQGEGRFGRSQWPEADAIRRMTDSYSPGHEPKKDGVDKFPRAQFGLPIIFEFKSGDVEKGDPSKTTLKGKCFERFASRLLLRSIVCQDGALGLALIMDAPMLPKGGLQLDGMNGKIDVNGNLTETEASQITPLKGERDVLKAFLDSIKNRRK